MAVKQIVTQESINPNLIPMIDIMFLILLFFMLSADMGARELEDVILPIATNVVKDETEENPKASPRLLINCYHPEVCKIYDAGEVCVDDDHWKIGIRGTDYTKDTLKERLQKEADVDRDPNNLTVSERKVQIRADRSALYGHVQRVMNTCAEVGIYKIEIGAAAPPAE
jgi:biopolymer transport protein ExbD